MAEVKRKAVCQECGCHCDTCVNNNSIHLYREIEHLKRQLAEREYHIMQMETSIMHHAKKFPNGEYEAVQETLRFWQEKYERLLEGHRKLQKVNQGLEDKLLRIVDKFETEKSALTHDIADLTTKLVEARVSLTDLEEENELYKNDCNIAVQLLQCKPSNFVGHKLNTLPIDLQEKVRSHFNHRRTRSHPCNTSSIQQPNSTAHNNSSAGAKIIKVPISTFPPTAMVYSVNKYPEESPQSPNAVIHNGNDYVSAAIMAKVLEERSKERLNGKHLMKCHQCRNRRAYVEYVDQETQTRNGILSHDDFDNHHNFFINSNSRQRSESSSSMDSLCGSYNSNIISNSKSTFSNETIII